MEANKERKEQTEKQRCEKDPMAKAREVVREAVMGKSCDYGEADNGQNRASANAQQPEDVLAYSRTVLHTDSSLE